jgi:hypothetical protein
VAVYLEDGRQRWRSAPTVFYIDPAALEMQT